MEPVSGQRLGGDRRRGGGPACGGGDLAAVARQRSEHERGAAAAGRGGGRGGRDRQPGGRGTGGGRGHAGSISSSPCPTSGSASAIPRMSPRSSCCLAVGVAVSQLAAHARRLKVIAITDAKKLGWHRRERSRRPPATARSSEAVLDHIRAQLVDLLDLVGCRFEYGMLLGHPPRLEHDGTVRTVHGRWNVEEAGLPRSRGGATGVQRRPVLRPVHADPEAGLHAVTASAPGSGHAGRPGRPRAGGQACRPERPVTTRARRCPA